MLVTALEMAASQCGAKMDVLIPVGAPWIVAIERLGGILSGEEEVAQSGAIFSAYRYIFSVLSEQEHRKMHA